jgi:hypothetical protein
MILKGSTFLDIMPCSPFKVNRRFEGTCRLPTFKLVSWLTYTSTLKMEETRCSETSVDFQRTARRYISEDIILHNHRCENLKFYTIILNWMDVTVE